MSQNEENRRGIRILVLEGAGAKGLSQLTILTELMNRVQEQLGLDEVPAVHEWFEFVVGVDTAALIAALVGRLRMSVEEAITCFKKLGSEVYSNKKTLGRTVGPTEYKTSKLVQTLKAMVRGLTDDENETMVEAESNPGCKTMIFAMSKHNMNAGIPTIFRSYHGHTNQMPNCTLWEAIAASMAHPAHFKSIDIGEPPMHESFVAGSMGCSNPTAYALEEVKRIYPRRYVACVVVIGTGHAGTIHIPELNQMERVLSSAGPNVVGMSLAMDSERVAHEMAKRFRSTRDFYFRLSVEQGMQNIAHDGWDQLGKVVAHTRAYIRQPDVSEGIDRIVKAVVARPEAVPATSIDGEVTISAKSAMVVVKICPSPTPLFTGRQDKIDHIISCVSKGDTERCTYVLYGLGGSGKTQLALKTVEQTRDTWTDILFVDATSHETATNALAGYAKQKGIGESYESALAWLGSQQEKWLMVIDNADDPKVDIRTYFPAGSTGSILVTTRVKQHAMLAQGEESDHQVTGMMPEEAMELLMKSTKLKESGMMESEREACVQLLEELGYLALAIAQASAYIFCSECTISRYLDMFQKHRQATLERSKKLPIKLDGYQKSVYTTWHMSYELLETNAQRLLHLIAFMHHSAIAEDTFQRAAINLQAYEPAIPPTEYEKSVQSFVAESLRPYLDSTGAWDSSVFLETVTELLSYSLISYDRENNTYTMHVLVHDWASTVIDHATSIAIDHTALLLAASIDYGDSTENLEYICMVEVHVNRLLERQAQPNANNALRFECVYHRSGRWKQMESMAQIALGGARQALGEQHNKTLNSMNNLAYAYREQGRFKEAATLQEQVVELKKRVLGCEHRETLLTMRNLTHTYHALGRYKDAESLQLQILQTSMSVYGEGHPETISSMFRLAITYNDQGAFNVAETLLVRVVDAWKRTKGDEHPDTLASMRELAHTYYRQRRYDEAVPMQEHILEATRSRQGARHHFTLSSMHGLAATYCAQGRYSEAEALQVRVVDDMKRAYGEDHPETLTCMNNLANTYHFQGRFQQAEKLGKQVMTESKRVLGVKHPRTLKAMRDLLATYLVLGESCREEYDKLIREMQEM